MGCSSPPLLHFAGAAFDLDAAVAVAVGDTNDAITVETTPRQMCRVGVVVAVVMLALLPRSQKSSGLNRPSLADDVDPVGLPWQSAGPG